MTRLERCAAQVALVGFFCAAGCVTPLAPPSTPATPGDPAPAAEAATPATEPSPAALLPPLDPRVDVAETPAVVTLRPVNEPRYAPPESLQQFRYRQKNQAAPAKLTSLAKAPAQVATSAPVSPPTAAAATAPAPTPTPAPLEARQEVIAPPVRTVNVEDAAPRYKLPDSLKEWRAGDRVPLYEDPNAQPWQAAPAEERLRNAAVSCNYKDEGGVRGKVMLLIDDFKVSRFNARIEMPNGGVCQFDGKKMTQRPFEQGIALAARDDECVVRMWEQKHRITVAAYSCHKQCSKGSFSYLWPILMDTRLGTCY